MCVCVCVCVCERKRESSREGAALGNCAFLEGCTQRAAHPLRQEVQVMILVFRVAIHGNFSVSPTTRGQSNP